MKKHSEILTVRGCEYAGCSYYGNPKKRLILEDAAGNVFTATTANNAMCGYLHFSTGKKYSIEYHYTRVGNVVIDYAADVRGCAK